ncbi:MAG: DUF2723 domain-containing protein [Vicinamibacteria bacterium]
MRVAPDPPLLKTPALERPSLKARLGVAASVSGVCLVAYWMTHGSGPFWQDSGLFLAALHSGGGLLPPGYPIYLILGRPFVAAFLAVLPNHTFAEAVNMFSAVWSALAAGLVSLSIFTLCEPHGRFFSLSRAAKRPSMDPRSVLFGGGLGGLMAGLSYSLWFQALTAEAYALNAFFTAAFLCLVIRLGNEGPLDAPPTLTQRRLAYLLLIAHGLSFGNHPVTVVLTPAVVWLAWIGRKALSDRRFFLTAFAIYVASAVLPYVYLPMAARLYPWTPYSGVSTLSGFVAQMSGSQWTAQGGNYGFSLERFALVPRQLWLEMFLIGIMGALIGVRVLFNERRGVLLFFALVLGPAFLVPLLYLRGGEYDFWLLTAYVPLFLISGFGLASFATTLTSGRPKATSFAVMVVLSMAALAPALVINRPLVDRRDDFVPEDFGRNLLRHLDPNAVFIAMSDQENALTYYLDVVEKERPDVVRIDGGVLATRWFPSQLRARYPDFEFEDISQGRDTVPSTDEWLTALIASAARTHAVYMTSRPAVPVPAGMDWIPSGGLWKLAPQNALGISRADWDYTYRNPDPFARPARDHAPEIMPDGSIRREPYTNQIRRFHVQAWKNLGDWSVAHDDYKEAVSAYTNALKMDPSLDNAGVFFGLGKSLFVLDRPKEARPYLEKVGERLDPSAVIESSLYLFQIYEGEGDRRKASQFFEKIRVLAPDLAARIQASQRK